MANYIFEQMTAEQAVSFDSTIDNLFFLTGSASDLVVTFNQGGGLSNSSITLTMGTVSRTFVASGLVGEQFVFFGDPDDQSTVEIGSNDTAAPDDVTITGVEGFGARYLALAGDDTIEGSDASDTIWGGAGDDSIVGVANGDATDADYLNGGAGDDTILGSDANDHIWGNESVAAQGTVDGDDFIDAGEGKNYVNGNAGNDTILGGTDNDRLYGGADDDTLVGDDGFDYLQGNKGDDSLLGGAGEDTLRGGANDDTLDGGDDDDVLLGDAGDDVLIGGDGYDTLTGGAGEDVFVFGTGEADDAEIGGDDLTDVIVDFTQGDDTIVLPFAVTDILVGPGGANFTSLEAAQLYADGLLEGGALGEIAAVQVGADTYLFFDDAGAAGVVSDSAIRLVGITAEDLEVDTGVIA